MSLRLTDKIAIVTGAGQGIGKAVALRLAQEGADVVVAELNPRTAAETAQAIERRGRRAMAYAIDLADVAAIQVMVDAVVARYGRIDILVNNAGVTHTVPLLELSERDWDRVIDVNQKGLFFCLQRVAAQMVKQVPETVKRAGRAGGSYGKIVNFSSISGRRGRSYAAHYAASKAAVISITQSAALALAPYGINVNAVAPGVVPTPMWDQLDAEKAELFGMAPGQALQEFIEGIPLKRAASPEQIAAAVAFLCTSDADSMTGQTLNVDGGYEMD